MCAASSRSSQERAPVATAGRWFVALALLLSAGCEGIGWPVVNLGDRLQAERTFLEKVGTAELYSEAGKDDRLWIEIPSDSPDGVVRGYLSTAAPERNSLIILLDGAATLNPDGREGQVVYAFDHFGAFVREHIEKSGLSMRNRDLHVLQTTHLSVDSGGLECAQQAEPRDFLYPQLRDLLAFEADRAGVDGMISDDRVE